MRHVILAMGFVFLGACAENNEGESSDTSSALYGATDDRVDPVCAAKGSVESALGQRVGVLVPDDGTTPCSLVIVSQTSTDAAQYALSVARCKPRPGVTVTAWFGKTAPSCGSRLVSTGEGYPVAFVAQLEAGDNLPALYKLPGTAWKWSGLTLNATPTVPVGAPLVVGQVDGDDPRVLVASSCTAGITLGGAFTHFCDTSVANGAPEIPQGAPILTLAPSGGYDLVGVHVGQAGGQNAGVNLAGLAPLLALVPQENATPLD